MKYLKYILIIFIVGTVSCDNYLDHVNPNNLSSDALGESESDLTMLLVGCYDALQVNFGNAWNSYNMIENFSDVGYGTTAITEGGGTPQSGFFENYWTKSYRLIARCNELIATIEQIESPADPLLVIEGEAKFLRALAYYYLAVLYKDTPLITERQSFDNRFVTKNSQSEIKAQILNDLDDAISVLAVNPEYPRASKGAALTLKTRTLCYFNQWDEALNTTQDIISLNKYSLFPDFETLFKEESENNSEAIFAIAYETGMGEGEGLSGSWPKQPQQMAVRPLPEYVDAFYCTDGLPISESQLYDPENFYEDRDPRYEVSILREGEIWSNGKPYEPGTSPTGYSLQKYVRISLEYRNDGPVDFMVFRFADVLLMRAEALIETNPSAPEIYHLINQVRSRVDMPTIEEVEGSGLSQSELRELVRHERLVELGLEGGIRWFDIKRWGIVEEVYNSITFHNRPFLGEKTLYWPIPQVEIDNNPNLTQHDWWN